MSNSTSCTHLIYCGEYTTGVLAGPNLHTLLLVYSRKLNRESLFLIPGFITNWREIAAFRFPKWWRCFRFVWFSETALDNYIDIYITWSADLTLAGFFHTRRDRRIKFNVYTTDKKAQDGSGMCTATQNSL